MNLLINALIRLVLLRDDLDYHLMRASLVILFLFFGYQKWFDYEAQVPQTELVLERAGPGARR